MDKKSVGDYVLPAAMGAVLGTAGIAANALRKDSDDDEDEEDEQNSSVNNN